MSERPDPPVAVPGPASEAICPGCKRPVSECQAEDVYEVVDAPDPVVSPADTPAAARIRTALLDNGDSAFVSVRVDDAAALLAVGERDKAELEPLRKALADAGLPATASVDDLIQHHRNSAALAAAFDQVAERERDRQQIARLTDLFKPEPYEGVMFKLVCAACGGRGEVPGRNHDDARWLPCTTCGGDGLSTRARAVLAGEEDARP